MGDRIVQLLLLAANARNLFADTGMAAGALSNAIARDRHRICI
jgi:hypothetical protein